MKLLFKENSLTLSGKEFDIEISVDKNHALLLAINMLRFMCVGTTFKCFTDNTKRTQLVVKMDEFAVLGEGIKIHHSYTRQDMIDDIYASVCEYAEALAMPVTTCGYLNNEFFFSNKDEVCYRVPATGYIRSTIVNFFTGNKVVDYQGDRLWIKTPYGLIIIDNDNNIKVLHMDLKKAKKDIPNFKEFSSQVLRVSLGRNIVTFSSGHVYNTIEIPIQKIYWKDLFTRLCQLEDGSEDLEYGGVKVHVERKDSNLVISSSGCKPNPVCIFSTAKCNMPYSVYFDMVLDGIEEGRTGLI